MRLLITSLVAIPFFCITANVLATEIPTNLGPAVIELKMGDDHIQFQHLKHQKRNNNECFHCHKSQEWKIKKWDKEVAHQVCIACHDLNDNGPVECKGCHKK